MKFFVSLFLLVLLFPAISAKAQNTVQSSGFGKKDIQYQSPVDGEMFVQQRTTLIIRLAKQLVTGHSAQDFSFIVRGELSGIHSGIVVISDDNETVTFKPDQPFVSNESVSVTFSIANAENFIPLKFNFRITPMSEAIRNQALSTLNQKVEEENEALIEASASLPIGTDTILFDPAVVVIDTVTTHETGNIFFSPTGSVTSPFSFLAITSDTGTSLLFERDIPIGCGNFRMQPDGTLTYFRQEYPSPTGGVFSGRIDHLDKNMNLIDTFQCIEGFADLHDFQLLVNGHAILDSYDPRFVNMKDTLLASGDPQLIALAPKADTNELVFGAIIQELDQSKNVVFQWKSWDHFHIYDAAADIHMVPANKNDTIIDYMHINAAVMDPKDNNIIASFRHQDEVSKSAKVMVLLFGAGEANIISSLSAVHCPLIPQGFRISTTL
ncbi:MAG: aryl-sulfate sulfotransferase [Candidatus Kapaibacterium sp.]